MLFVVVLGQAFNGICYLHVLADGRQLLCTLVTTSHMHSGDKVDEIAL